MWTRHKQQQQRGVQFRPQGDAPPEAVEDRSAQDHEHAVVAVGPPVELPPGGYPASRLQDGDADNTPSAPDPHVDWDQVVQPERRETELEQDERGDDAEAAVDRMGAADAEAEAELRERAMERDADELDAGAARQDRND